MPNGSLARPVTASEGIQDREVMVPSTRMAAFSPLGADAVRVEPGVRPGVLATPTGATVPDGLGGRDVHSDAMRVRLVIAEDNGLLRDGMVRLFERVEDIDVIGSCSTLPELLAVVQSEAPDVV